MSNLNKNLGLDQIGLNNVSKIHRNLNVDNLIDEILKNNEGVISSTGAPVVDTGKFTGRSPKDKYIVDEPSSTNLLTKLLISLCVVFTLSTSLTLNLNFLSPIS